MPEYLKGFIYTSAVLNTPENLERTAYELAQDNLEEGVRYMEVRFAPQLHSRSELLAAAALPKPVELPSPQAATALPEETWAVAGEYTLTPATGVSCFISVTGMTSPPSRARQV